ncbi:hypothetical protein [Mucilaginibacter sp. UYCu711]|uniref:hypothetical protein n=1 Tax=Mucilaginibacter sp. UYCu711 TaxID=3156339 RepID=UPI003D1D691F
MRFTFLLAFCILSLTASAQFWRRKPKAPQPELESVHPAFSIVNKIPLSATAGNLPAVQLTHSVYQLEIAEEAMLKEAKHNMRFRIYNLASYNFSDLAALYLQQNRFSEAKWYLLQSNAIARQAENTRHLLDNLLILADIKTTIGENALAMVDLQEAHDVATAKAMLTDLTAIDNKIKYLQTNKLIAAKVALRYADAVEVANANKAAATVN